MEYTIMLGSNLGNKLMYLERAIEQLSVHCGTIAKKSQVYETASWGFEAPSFLNQAVIVVSELMPKNFFKDSKNRERVG